RGSALWCVLIIYCLSTYPTILTHHHTRRAVVLLLADLAAQAEIAEDAVRLLQVHVGQVWQLDVPGGDDDGDRIVRVGHRARLRVGGDHLVLVLARFVLGVHGEVGRVEPATLQGLPGLVLAHPGHVRDLQLTRSGGELHGDRGALVHHGAGLRGPAHRIALV